MSSISAIIRSKLIYPPGLVKRLKFFQAGNFSVKRYYPVLAALMAAAIGFAAEEKEAPNLYLFDMGSEDSPLMAGFARITTMTTYSPEKGYGWLNPSSNELTATCNKGVDALAGDCVRGRLNKTMTFRLDATNGDYTVWVLTGVMGNIWDLRYLRAPHDLLIQGKPAVRVEPKEEDLFRCANYDWSKGDDIFEQFIAPRFTWLRADATAVGGKLEIGFSPGLNFPVCAVVVAGRRIAADVEEKLLKIDRQRRDAFYQLWHEMEVKPPERALISAGEKQRGFIVAAAHCEDDLNPWSQPTPDASRTKIELFAVPGEQDQASFAVYALRDLHEVQYEVTDLKSAEGKVIPASVIERGLVQFLPWGGWDARQYTLKECLILPARPTLIGGDTCKRFWLTFRLPADTAGGIYEGKINISAADAPATTIDLRLRVIPIKLTVPPVERFMYFGTMYYLGRAYLPNFDEKLYWESMRGEVRFIKDNEFCRAECHHKWDLVMKDGKVVDVDCSDTDKLIKIIREENAWPRDNKMICQADGFNRSCGGWWFTPGKTPPLKFCGTPEDRAKFIDAIKIIARKAKEGNWPEVIFEAGGEYSNFREDGATYGLEAHGLFKEAGVPSALRGNGPYDMAAIAKGLVDYPQPNPAMMKAEWLKIMREKGKKLWSYNFCQNRFSMGWWCFKHNIVRASFESGIYANGQPGNFFGIDGMFPMGLPLTMTTFAPAIWLKRLVMGAGDYKYLYNLEQRIKEAQASRKSEAKKAAEAAKAYLDKKLADIPSSLEGWVGDPRAAGDIRGDFWPKHDLEKYRWQVAEHIMTIDEALGRGAK